MNTFEKYIQKNLFFLFILCMLCGASGVQAVTKRDIEEGVREAKRMDHIRSVLSEAGRKYAAKKYLGS